MNVYKANAGSSEAADDAVPPADDWPQGAGLGHGCGPDGFDRVHGASYEAAYEAMSRPDRVDFVEHGLRLLGDSGLPQEARSRVVRELLVRMVTDVSIPRASFEAHLVEIHTVCPEGLSAHAKEVFHCGYLSVALVLGDEVLRRLARLVELDLQIELRLQRSEHLLMLNEAMEAWAQARILHHEAMTLREGDDIPFSLVKVEARYRSQAMAQQQVFLRVWAELKKATAKQ